MKKELLCLLMVILIMVSTHAQPSENAYLKLREQLLQLSADESKTTDVKNIALKRDVGTFTMETGKLFLCTPIRGRILAAVFVGKGTFSYSPPTEVEKKQLSRFYDKETLEEKFKVLFLVFADSTLEELQSQLRFVNEKVSREVNDHITYAMNYPSDGGKDAYFDHSFMTTFLEDRHNDLFYAHFSNNKIEPMFFRIDPLAVEEVSFGRRNLSWPGYDWEIINQFHTQEEYESGADQEDTEKSKIRVTHHMIDATIERNMDFSASATLIFTSLKKNQRWIDFSLYPKLDVDSVFWAPHSPAIFVDCDDHYSFWVARDSALRLGQVCSLLVYYHGDLLAQDENARLYLNSSVLWYPRYDSRARGTYDLTFRYPSRYTFLSVGENLTSNEIDGQTESHWISKKPIKAVSFNFGLFREYIVGDSVKSLLLAEKVPLPQISVYMSEGQRRYSSSPHLVNPSVSMVSRDVMVERVRNDVARSAGYFQTLFGGRPFERLYASETPNLHGEAFPGMVNLPWGTYEYESTRGIDEIFRAHEVAHQWWGIAVGYKSYHDQWLSEGFSEYCGIWYMQAALRDNDKFFKVLNTWQDEIINNRTFAFGKGQEAGPVWLGYRTHSTKTRGDYDLIIYKKGAWVLHMLRNMLLDLKTMNEDRFKTMLADFYNQYKGHDASTLDFQRVVEAHFGSDMSWFFQQWVHGTNVPSYAFAHKIVKTNDTSYTVKCRLRQENVPPTFRMFVPIQVKLANGSFFRFRINASGEKMEFDLPTMSSEPTEVVFNYLESVLCENKSEDWD